MIFGLRSWKTYKVLKNAYSKMFAELGIGIALAMYFYGVTPLLFPDNRAYLGLAYLIALIPLVLGLNQSSRASLKALGFDSLEASMKYIVPSVLIIFFVLHFQHPPLPAIYENGIISWGVPFPFQYVFAVLVTPLALLTGIFLFTAKTISRKAFVKKTLFSITFFLGGLGGGLGVVLFTSYTMLLIFYIAMFIGFAFLGTMILVDIFMKEEASGNDEKTQIFTSKP